MVNADSLLRVTESFLNNTPPKEPPKITNVCLIMQEEKRALQEVSHTLSAPVVKYNSIQQTSGKKCDNLEHG